MKNKTSNNKTFYGKNCLLTYLIFFFFVLCICVDLGKDNYKRLI
jgi:hypothetical protein